jgi:hypothetical protein
MSVYTVATEEVPAPRLIVSVPLDSNFADAPAVCVVICPSIMKLLFDTEPAFAPVTIESSVNDPSRTFTVMVADEPDGVEYTPLTSTLRVRPTEFKVFAGTTIDVKSWADVVLAFTVTGLTSTLVQIGTSKLPTKIPAVLKRPANVLKIGNGLIRKVAITAPQVPDVAAAVAA